MNPIAAIRREYIYLTTVARTIWMLRALKPDATPHHCRYCRRLGAQNPGRARDLSITTGDELWRDGCARQAYAHWALSLGLKQGEPVALFMENRPDFICAWLGLFKAGLCAALINTNQRGQPLAHSIEIVGARHVIAGSELAACLPEAEPFFAVKPQFWIQGGGSGQCK